MEKDCEKYGIKPSPPRLNTNLLGVFNTGYENSLKEFLTSILTLKGFKEYSDYYPNRILKNFESIDKKYLSKLNYDYKKMVQKLKEGIDTNCIFLNKLIELNEPNEKYYKNFKMEELQRNSNYKQSLISDIFYYIMRDWTDDKDADKKKQYEPIKEELKKYVKNDINKHGKILIPGAGICRLAYEISLLGYDIDCNDYSYLNYFVSDLILTKSKKNEFSLFPFYGDLINFLKEEDQYKEFKFPNIETGLNKEGQGKMYYTLGDFTLMFNNCYNYYDSVITVYFIDSATNIIKYIDIINRILKKGGVWINFGPVAYDWYKNNTVYIPLPWDKQKEIMIKYGFEIVKEEHIFNSYCYLNQKMRNTLNLCTFFTAIKK